MKTLSIVIPVYYNSESLPILFEELLRVEKELLKKSIKVQLIFVDDGSGDDSWKVLLEIKKKREDTRLIKLTRNFGAVHASKAGLRMVEGDIFLILAADLQDPPDLILKMIERWERGSKFVICKRIAREDPFLSRVFSRFYYLILRLLVIPGYPINGYDLALMDRVMLPYLLKSAKNVNTPLFAYWLGFDPDVLHYHRRKRIHGRSRWSFWKKIKFFLDSILGFSIIPIRLISLIGFGVALLSMGYGGMIIVNFLMGEREVPGFATLATLISFMFGLVIIMLGIIGEYIWRSFDEVSRKPEAVIDEIH